MPFRPKHHCKYTNTYKHYVLSKQKPIIVMPPHKETEMQEQQLTEFDLQFEAFCAEQRKIKAEREAEQKAEKEVACVKKKRRKRKHADDQSDRQEETDLKV